MAEEKVKEVKTTEVKSTQPGEKHWTRPSNSTLTMIVLALVFFGLLCTAFTLGKRSSDRFDRADRFGSGTMMQGYSARSGATGGGMMESALRQIDRVIVRISLTTNERIDWIPITFAQRR